MNKNIVVLLGGSTLKFFKEGVLKKQGDQKVLKEWLDDKAGTLIVDKSATVLYKDDGSYKESSGKDRYKKGFKDII